MRAEKLSTEIRQNQIAQAALDIIAAEGVEGLSVAAVADRVGIVPSGIYRHYRGKEAMLDAALELILRRLADNVRAVCGQTTDPLERLERLLTLHVRLILENRGIPRLVFSEELYGGPSRRRGRVYGGIKDYLAEIEEIIRQGRAAGCIRPDVDPGVLALMFLGIIQPAAILWHMSEGELDVAGHAQKAWRVFAETIRAARPAPAE